MWKYSERNDYLWHSGNGIIRQNQIRVSCIDWLRNEHSMKADMFLEMQVCYVDLQDVNFGRKRQTQDSSALRVIIIHK